jgi:hypothetical protein
MDASAWERVAAMLARQEVVHTRADNMRDLRAELEVCADLWRDRQNT